MTTLLTTPTIATDYAARFPGSMGLWERARRRIPSGINHDVRRVLPFPLYMDRAQGCRKWDVDGNEFIDLCTGHGALILGHSHPAIVKAIQEIGEPAVSALEDAMQQNPYCGRAHRRRQRPVPVSNSPYYSSRGNSAGVRHPQVYRWY
jgi:4-aminobutyrate aminotransferase-like enzyme